MVACNRGTWCSRCTEVVVRANLVDISEMLTGNINMNKTTDNMIPCILLVITSLKWVDHGDWIWQLTVDMELFWHDLMCRWWWVFFCRPVLKHDTPLSMWLWLVLDHLCALATISHDQFLILWQGKSFSCTRQIVFTVTCVFYKAIRKSPAIWSTIDRRINQNVHTDLSPTTCCYYSRLLQVMPCLRY